METILFCSHKGGCGKTTSAINLATYLSLAGKKTLLIDLDPQAASTSGMGVDETGLQKQIYDVIGWRCPNIGCGSAHNDRRARHSS